MQNLNLPPELVAKARRAKRQCSIAFGLREEQSKETSQLPPWSHYMTLADQLLKMEEGLNKEATDGGEIRMF